MVTRQQVLDRWRQGGGYPSVGRQLGVSAGKAYLIATGIPADGSDSLAPEDHQREGLELGGTQGLLGVPHHNPNRPEERSEVMAWVRDRARAELKPARAGQEGA